MFRFIHLADLHLGAGLSEFGEVASARAEDMANAFERALDFAADESNGISAIVIAGDLFDSANPEQKWIDLAVRKLKEVKRNGVVVVATPGNHDSTGVGESIYTDRNSPLRDLLVTPESERVERFLTQSFDGVPVHFYGMAWQAGLSNPPFDQFTAEEEPGYHVALIHGTLKQISVGEEHANYVPLELEELGKSGMDYIALGHIHTPFEFDAEGVKVVYPGTLEGKRFRQGECGPRYLTVVELGESKDPKVENIEWNRRVIEQESLDMDVEAVETYGELADLIQRRFGDPDKLLRLTLTGTAPFIMDVEELQSRLQGEFFYLDLVDDTDVFDARVLSEWSQEDTIRGLFVRKLTERAEAAESDEREITELALKLAVQAFRRSRGG